MKRDAAVARRYARALHALASEARRAEAVADELVVFDQLLGSQQELREALLRPWVKAGTKRAIVLEVAGRLELSPLTRNFLALVAQRRRLDVLPEIIAAYRAVVDEAASTVQPSMWHGDDREWTLHRPRFLADELDSARAAGPWFGHRWFAYDLILWGRPDVIVELGTHYGVSFFAFCQAVLDAGYPAELHAVDTSAGDEHAGIYGEEVFERLKKIDLLHRHRALREVAEILRKEDEASTNA